MSPRFPAPSGRPVERAALWAVARARVDGDSTASAAATETLLAAGYASRLADTVALTVDVITGILLDLGDAWTANPACAAEGALTSMEELTPPARFPLFAAYQSLRVQDGTGESHGPHPTCRPWPPGMTVVSFGAAAGGALLATALEVVPGVHGLEEHPATVLLVNAPETMLNLVWALSGYDQDRFVALLDAGAAAY